MYRVVVDPGVLVSALISPRGVPAALYLRWRAGDFELVVSPMLLDELERVLKRDRFRAYATLEEVAVYVATVRREAITLDDPPDPLRITRDPKDDYLIARARAARAHYLVSGDRDLTEVKDPVPPILKPRELVAVLDLERRDS